MSALDGGVYRFQDCVGDCASLKHLIHFFLRTDAYMMVRNRLLATGICGDIYCHSFRATGITNYLETGCDLEMAVHRRSCRQTHD